ncbi:MAG TPA: hypothetical protein VNZ06_01380 [Steroidobacteraceae bacterium]|jgi:O-antigen/teichoic acid export membrane protein|nr:hypothetical protein [Steroidobacteraceae bacterium]
MPTGVLRSLFKSKSLRAASAFGASGAALAIGNLLLARVLSPEHLASFSLVFALVMIGVNVGPMGADVILTRNHYDTSSKLHLQVFLTSCAVGLLLILTAIWLYPLSFALLAAVFITTVAGSVKVVATSYYRSQERFLAALALTASTNASILVAGVASMFVARSSALLPTTVMTVTMCSAALIGWYSVVSDRERVQQNTAQSYPWNESWHAANFIAASMIMTSLERITVPKLLDLPTLATFAVLATLAGSPFTILYQGVSFTLVPALRNAPDARARRRVFGRETAIIAASCVLAAFAAWWLTPLFLTYVLAGRYHIAPSLLSVAIISGILKVVGTLPASAVNALGSASHLVKLSMAGWLTIAVSLVGAAIGSRWGLAGLVSGVAAGWLVRALVIGWLAFPLFSKSAAPAMGSTRQSELAR